MSHTTIEAPATARLDRQAGEFHSEIHSLLKLEGSVPLSDCDDGGTIYYVMTTKVGRLLIQVNEDGKVVDVVAKTEEVLDLVLPVAQHRFDAVLEVELFDDFVINFRFGDATPDSLEEVVEAFRAALPAPMQESFAILLYRTRVKAVSRHPGFVYSQAIRGYLRPC